jgi:hypothetical protein
MSFTGTASLSNVGWSQGRVNDWRSRPSYDGNPALARMMPIKRQGLEYVKGIALALSGYPSVYSYKLMGSLAFLPGGSTIARFLLTFGPNTHRIKTFRLAPGLVVGPSVGFSPRHHESRRVRNESNFLPVEVYLISEEL